jgi:very-short-patch-repair endonuclease
MFRYCCHGCILTENGKKWERMKIYFKPTLPSLKKGGCNKIILMSDDFWESKLVARRGHLKYLEELGSLSRINRKKPTRTENIVWYEILNSRKTGFKFLRQKPISKFILDFYCKELLLAIEIDGSYHNKRKNYDEERDKFLRNLNIETIRISVEDVTNNLNKIKYQINKLIESRKVSLFKGNVTTLPAGRQE